VLQSDVSDLHRQVQARQRRTPCMVDDGLDEEVALEELGRKVVSRLCERAHAIEVDIDDLAGGSGNGTGQH